jgi:hypothetical protein
MASAEVRVLNRRLISSNDGNPLETGAGAVSEDEKAPNAHLGEVMFGRNPVY